LSAAASIYAGMLLNRLTRSGVLLALLLASLVYLLLNVSTTYIFNREIFMAQLKLAEDPVTAAAFGVGVMLIPLIVFLSGGIGIIISRLNRDRTIGRLSNAARRLKPEERDAVTQDVLDRLAADR
jgi:Na+/H+-translocating membrane pyrophosphatase